MKKIKGYIFSRSFMGERTPQHVQNLVIRDYCKKNDLQYQLSLTEYAMTGSYLMHQNLMNDLESIDGIVAYSLFQLPESSSHRKEIYKKIIELNKVYHFAVEGLNFKDQGTSEKIEALWQVKKTLPHCYKPK